MSDKDINRQGVARRVATAVAPAFDETRTWSSRVRGAAVGTAVVAAGTAAVIAGVDVATLSGISHVMDPELATGGIVAASSAGAATFGLGLGQLGHVMAGDSIGGRATRGYRASVVRVCRRVKVGSLMVGTALGVVAAAGAGVGDPHLALTLAETAAGFAGAGVGSGVAGTVYGIGLPRPARSSRALGE